MSHPSDKGNDPTKMNGLRQAMYILDCLQDGITEDQIIKNCDGDNEMVKVWLDFLKDNRWVIKDAANNRWVLTDNGKQQMTNYYYAK